MSIQAFNADLQGFATALGLSLDKVVRGFGLQLFDDITEATPVDTGRARSNWNAAENAPDLSITADLEQPHPAGRLDEKNRAFVPDGGKEHVKYPIADHNSSQRLKINSASGKEPIYITNSIVYVPALEDGHSGQAPQGMVRPAITKALSQVARIIAQNKV